LVGNELSSHHSSREPLDD